MKEKDPMLLIIAGALMAVFMPFAMAFPPTFVLKALAVSGLAAASLGAAWAIRRLQKKKPPEGGS